MASIEMADSVNCSTLYIAFEFYVKKELNAWLTDRGTEEALSNPEIIGNNLYFQPINFNQNSGLKPTNFLLNKHVFIFENLFKIMSI